MNLKSVTKEVNNSHVNKSPKITSLSKLSDNVKDNTLTAVNILLKRFLHDVSVTKNPIKIHDTKELRDVISVFQVIEQIEGGASSTTPQINTEAINFFTSQTKEPHTSQGAENSVNKKLPNLSSNQVDKLMKNQQTYLDKKNLHKM